MLIDIPTMLMPQLAKIICCSPIYIIKEKKNGRLDENQLERLITWNLKFISEKIII